MSLGEEANGKNKRTAEAESARKVRSVGRATKECFLPCAQLVQLSRVVTACVRSHTSVPEQEGRAISPRSGAKSAQPPARMMNSSQIMLIVHRHLSRSPTAIQRYPSDSRPCSRRSKLGAISEVQQESSDDLLQMSYLFNSTAISRLAYADRLQPWRDAMSSPRAVQGRIRQLLAPLSL